MRIISIEDSYNCTLEREDLLALKGVSNNKEISNIIENIEAFEDYLSKYPVSFNPKQDKRDCKFIWEVAENAQKASLRSISVSSVILSHCHVCLSECKYHVFTRGGRWHKKGELDLRRPIYETPGVRIEWSIQICMPCLKRVRPHLIAFLKSLGMKKSLYKTLEEVDVDANTSGSES